MNICVASLVMKIIYIDTKSMQLHKLLHFITQITNDLGICGCVETVKVRQKICTATAHSGYCNKAHIEFTCSQGLIIFQVEIGSAKCLQFNV